MAVCVPADSRFESGTESERAIVRPRRRPPRRRRPLPARPLVRPELGGHDTRARRYGIGRRAGRFRFLVPEQHSEHVTQGATAFSVLSHERFPPLCSL